MASADVETRRVPDVISAGPRSSKGQRMRRYSRKTSEESEASPRLSIPPVESRKQRMRVLPGGQSRRQQAAGRRSSESAVLPPIRLSSLSQFGPSPTQDANLTSSPTSNLSLHGASLAEEEDGVLLATYSEREMRSPHTRKDAQSRLSVLDNNADTPRLSPIDPQRLKPDRRTLKSVNDVTHDVTTGAKTPTVPAEASVPTSKAAVRSKSNRRVSMQSLPKLSVMEEPFSIRRKIEQFRKWHEEQYADKLKKLKVEAEREFREAKPRPQTKGSTEIDFTKLLEDNIKDSLTSPRKSATKKDVNGNQILPTPPKAALVGSPRRSTRCKSAATWHTWRDVNDSYAYDDVMRYIEENELLPKERVDWIHVWLGEVEKAMRGGGDKTDLEDRTVGVTGYP